MGNFFNSNVMTTALLFAVFSCYGESMLPLLPDGHKVGVESVSYNEIELGDVIVYEVQINHLPVAERSKALDPIYVDWQRSIKNGKLRIMHRVILKVPGKNGYLILKGDNNPTADKFKIRAENIVGKVNLLGF